jgi:putative glycosyltransferase
MTIISIVTTLYKSRRFLEKYLNDMTHVLEELNITDYELIFVNDGSPDDSLAYILGKKKVIKQIKVIDLSRNFGHHYALQAGMKYASANFIYIVDNDLETPASFLKECYETITYQDDLDVVYGFQERRKGHFVEKIGGFIFWKLFNLVSDITVPSNILTERLMKKQVVDELLRLNDANLFLGGMSHWVGFNQVGLAVKKGIREGKSTYSFRKRLQLMIQAIVSFTGKPLEWLFYFGITVLGISIILILFFLTKKIIYGDNIELGWTSIVVLNIFGIGLLSTFLGIIGIYIFKIFRQVQGRPNVIIKNIYE